MVAEKAALDAAEGSATVEGNGSAELLELKKKVGALQVNWRLLALTIFSSLLYGKVVYPINLP